MSRPPQYGDVMRDQNDGSLWMLICNDRNEETGKLSADWQMIPLTDSPDEEAQALDDTYYGSTDGMEFV